MSRPLSLFLFCLMAPASFADVVLPSVFADHLVLQRDRSCPIWGRAEPGEAVSVRFGEHFATTMADADGNWDVALPPMPASAEGRALQIEGSNQIVLEDVLVGEVWLCSGQSNMEWTVAASARPEEERQAAQYPRIRLFKAAHTLKNTPQFSVPGQWTVCSPETAANFSAVAYYFGRRLLQDLDVPIGLISTNWGGSRAEPWASAPHLSRHPLYADTMAELEKDITAWQSEDPGAREKRYQEKLAAFKDQIGGYWKAIARDDTGMKEGWFAADFDDSAWPTASLPGLWDREGGELPGRDGFVWYRRTVDIPAEWAGQDLRLGLGAIDDSDRTFFGGQPVGSIIGQWTAPREYLIPGAQVKAGPTSIAVLVLDTGGGGGFNGPAEQLQLRPAAGGEGLALNGEWRYQAGGPVASGVAVPALPQRDAEPGTSFTSPAAMYNGMIHPFVPYAMRGAIWYQGESNAGQAEEYRELLPLMIQSWRDAWGQGDFPFGIVQLASFYPRSNDPVQGGWALLRDAQLHTARTVPNTGLIVTTDVGDAKDIHPKNKQEVGRRLALWALAGTYDQELEFSGPVFRSMERRGEELVLHFDHAAGLRSADGQALRGFALGDFRDHFVWARARIEDDTVVVSADDIPFPMVVRFGWCNNPEDCNLVNGAGLPATPFRSDG